MVTRCIDWRNNRWGSGARNCSSGSSKFTDGVTPRTRVLDVDAGTGRGARPAWAVDATLLPSHSQHCGGGPPYGNLRAGGSVNRPLLCWYDVLFVCIPFDFFNGPKSKGVVFSLMHSARLPCNLIINDSILNVNSLPQRCHGLLLLQYNIFTLTGSYTRTATYLK